MYERAVTGQIDPAGVVRNSSIVDPKYTPRKSHIIADQIGKKEIGKSFVSSSESEINSSKILSSTPSIPSSNDYDNYIPSFIR
jgi:hypothetical protein